VITFAHRIQGLMIAHENPHRIMQLSDLAEPQLRFVSRDPGSGSRLWLDAEMQKHHITLTAINCYQKTVKSECEAATLIGTGKADVAIGLQATARQHGLDFIPLFEERYDLILRRKNKQLLQLLLDYLQTTKFCAQLNTFNGYNSTHSGERILLNRGRQET
jgi:putative molybdopterin biosynthesis protein